MPNAIDLTKVANVKSWMSLPTTATDQDQTIQDSITAFSSDVLHFTGRGPMDGTVPTQSPFVTPVSYDDFYDGSGSLRQPIRNWPITAVALVNVNGQVIPQSVNVQTWGWVIDGDKKFISIRGGYSPSVATFQNYRYQGGGAGLGVQGPGFASGSQNVEVQYTAGFSGVPFDLEMVARRTVALRYKGRGWIGQRSQMMAAGAGTVFYNGWEIYPADRDTILYYQARVAS